jgi:hypothetical protein
VNIFVNTTNQTMNPENHAWNRLCEHAGAQISAGFAERTLCSARCAPKCTPRGQFALSAATAAVCAATVILFFSQFTRIESSRNLAGWQAIASANDDLIQGQ